MSQENVEIVRGTFDTLNADDNRARWRPDAPWDPNVIVIPPSAWPDADEIRGLEAWGRQLDRMRESWEEVRLEVDDIRPADRGRVVTAFRYVTKGKDSGIVLDTPMGAVHTLRNGKIVRMEFFDSPAQALEAAGLSE